ncbi:hypothetical protein HAV15_002690 [Penicillium sp. str. |nr:hypothetical protein HAV15_002690 [Penicillium sp. str. \
MAFCITFGTHEFSSQLEGYEHVRAYCYNCQHWNGHCITRWPFFTICFIPLIPLAMHKYKEVQCYTCRYTQDLRDRPDITPDTHGLRQACNMASSRPLRPKEAGSNSLLCSLPLKHRVELDTNEFPKMFEFHKHDDAAIFMGMGGRRRE